MELNVSVKALKEEIESAKQKYLASQDKQYKIYVKKTAEYAKYVAKCVADGKEIKKYPPSLYHSNTSAFDDALDGISMYEGDFIQINSGELANLRRGLKDIVAGSMNSVTTLSSLRY
jgi:hypothetical protein